MFLFDSVMDLLVSERSLSAWGWMPKSSLHRHVVVERLKITTFSFRWRAIGQFYFFCMRSINLNGAVGMLWQEHLFAPQSRQLISLPVSVACSVLLPNPLVQSYCRTLERIHWKHLCRFECLRTRGVSKTLRSYCAGPDFPKLSFWFLLAKMHEERFGLNLF